MIYLDNNATALLDPEVLKHILPLHKDILGNPSSIHTFGQRAKGLLFETSARCAQFFKVKSDEIIFTSGATEALNLLLHAIPKHAHVITSSLEHPAVIETLKRSSAAITYLDPLYGKGSITASQIKNAMQNNTAMIVLMAANNETGIKTDVEAIAKIADEAGIAFVVDYVALLGKDSFSLPKGVTAAAFSGHKIHAPYGVGAAIVRKNLKMEPLILGGPQQKGRRAGTENLPGIIGFVKALELLDDKWIVHMETLKNRFEEGIKASVKDIIIHGENEPRVANTSNISFLGVDGETLLMTLDLNGLAASHGSACSSGTFQTSRVLLSMGIEPKIARSSIRFSLSRFTTQEEIDRSIALCTEAVLRLRAL